MSKFIKNGELQDEIIIKTLKKCADDYENGEIIEVQDTLIEIVNAIQDFADHN